MLGPLYLFFYAFVKLLGMSDEVKISYLCWCDAMH